MRHAPALTLIFVLIAYLISAKSTPVVHAESDYVRRQTEALEHIQRSLEKISDRCR